MSSFIFFIDEIPSPAAKVRYLFIVVKQNILNLFSDSKLIQPNLFSGSKQVV